MRIVLAASDFTSAYELIQHAFDLSEKYQVPLIVLTEKQIAEGLYNVQDLPESPTVHQHILTATEDSTELKRYEFTASGVSQRWLPGSDLPQYNANGDEHDEIGDVNEESGNAKLMAEKRLKKIELIKAEFPEPIMFGDENADLTFIGWGSVKATVLDSIDILKQNNSGLSVNYLHYEYLFPLRTKKLLDLLSKSKRVVLIENNYLGQLGQLIASETGYIFKEKLLKYDGRPFFIEDVLNFINK